MSGEICELYAELVAVPSRENQEDADDMGFKSYNLVQFLPLYSKLRSNYINLMENAQK